MTYNITIILPICALIPQQATIWWLRNSKLLACKIYSILLGSPKVDGASEDYNHKLLKTHQILRVFAHWPGLNKAIKRQGQVNFPSRLSGFFQIFRSRFPTTRLHLNCQHAVMSPSSENSAFIHTQPLAHLLMCSAVQVRFVSFPQALCSVFSNFRFPRVLGKSRGKTKSLNRQSRKCNTQWLYLAGRFTPPPHNLACPGVFRSWPRISPGILWSWATGHAYRDPYSCRTL